MKRPLIVGLAVIVGLTGFFGAGSAAEADDSVAPIGDHALASAQPRNAGRRLQDIRTWTPQTDPYAAFLRAQIPLQPRIAHDPDTQTRHDLDGKAEVMLMQGDYGNSFFGNFRANDGFANNTLNFWQYADYWSPWHGAATPRTPEALYDPATSDWRTRNFEFGIVDIPNPAYTNAAHRNGVKSIATIYFDPAFRPGLTFDEAFDKDPNSEGYIIAEKLVEMARYFGFDGYFLNEEEGNLSDPRFKPFMSYLTSKGLYTQWYTNSSGEFSESKSKWLDHGKIMDSVFLNYTWPGSQDRSIASAKASGYDPYKALFFGVEANQAGFGGHHRSASQLPNLYTSAADHSPKASIALFTPSDMYQRGLADDIKPQGAGKDVPVFQQDPYQWMIAERERMYFSGVTSNPQETGSHLGHSRPEVGVKDSSSWVGVADFTPARSVIAGSRFHTDFNTGHGMQWYQDGEVSNPQSWTNMDSQSILPSWQWWIDTEGSRPSVDFDYGPTEQRKDVNGAPTKTPYQQIGAWRGGSSLVIHGDLTDVATLRLFKTRLSVSPTTTMPLTFRKSSASGDAMKVALVFADDPGNVVTVDVPDSAARGQWRTSTVDLGKFSGRTITTIGLQFDPASGYQMNLGSMSVRDGAKAPQAPQQVKLDKVYDDGQAVLSWQTKPFDEVSHYVVEASGADGKTTHLTSAYTDLAYVKTVPHASGKVTFTVRAVGHDGQMSEPATVAYDYSAQPRHIKVAESATASKLLTEAAKPGALDVTWDAHGLEGTCHVDVGLVDVTDDNIDNQPYKLDVPCSKGSATVPLPVREGYPYDLTITAGDGQGLSYRGRSHDSWAAPVTRDDMVVDKDRSGFHMRNLSSPDWYLLDLTWQGQDGALSPISKIRRGGSVRGGWGASPTTDDPTAFHRFPAADGTLVMTVTDYAGNTTVQRFTIKDHDVVVPSEKPSFMMKGKTTQKVTVGQPIDPVTVTVTGAAPLTWRIRDSLPEGLSWRNDISGDGLTPLQATVSGSMATSGTHKIVIEATDLYGNTASQELVVEAVAAPAPSPSVPTPTATPTSTPTATPTSTPTATPTSTPTATPTSTVSGAQTPTAAVPSVPVAPGEAAPTASATVVPTGAHSSARPRVPGGDTIRVRLSRLPNTGW
ncbi:endo-beta-N-acetylglucosaminidase [Cutibacterium equinum]|uniref:Endo-beta-N-acetylglucosaminidase n=1 Tax=Cutibacterium equinum TaxID=3016342 RepID=A0ABY7QXM5_9ACTN|nr:endo-beta-N-acetylglucosaminidase [Cutibacterium equinum]WCC79272.1 endo-beta-N-acetylglucosaminidase [Cutibacterium equinum]